MTETEDLQPFHNDLCAAVAAGVKLEIGEALAPGAALSIKKLEQLKLQASRHQAVPGRYRAAIDVWQATGSMIPVLEGLSIRKKAWRRIGGLFRNSLIHVLLIAVLAIVALVHYQLNVLPQIEDLRQHITLLGKPGERLSPSSAGFWSKLVTGLFVVLLLWIIASLRNGGYAKAGWWFGGGSYMRCQTMATASRTMQLLVSRGVDPTTAATLSGTLTGLDHLGQGELLYSVKDRSDREVLSPALADYMAMIADHQYITARTWGPGALVVAVGGVFAFLFVLLAYGPIASLLEDLCNSASL